MSLLALAWAARYLIAVVVFLALVARLVDLARQRDRARKAANALIIRNAELAAETTRLRAEVHAVQRRYEGRAPMLRGPVVNR